jgi:hypothetical protein
MAINIEERRFKLNHSSSSAHQTRETDAPAIITPAITVLNVFMSKENAWHSLTIKAREGMHTRDGEKRKRGG